MRVRVICIICHVVLDVCYLDVQIDVIFTCNLAGILFDSTWWDNEF